MLSVLLLVVLVPSSGVSISTKPGSGCPRGLGLLRNITGFRVTYFRVSGRNLLTQTFSVLETFVTAPLTLRSNPVPKRARLLVSQRISLRKTFGVARKFLIKIQTHGTYSCF